MSQRCKPNPVPGALGMVLGCLVLLGPSAPAQEVQWQTYLDDGTKAYQAGRYSEAEKLLKLALALGLLAFLLPRLNWGARKGQSVSMKNLSGGALAAIS